MYACNEYGRGIKRPALVVYMVMPKDGVRVSATCEDTGKQDFDSTLCNRYKNESVNLGPVEQPAITTVNQKRQPNDEWRPRNEQCS